MSSRRLAGRVVLVTGAAQGQGAAEARAFVAEGANVVLADVRDQQGEATARELGGSARYFHLDVTSEHDWSAAVAKTIAAFGKLDGLVNNAGILRYSPLADTTLEDWNTVIAVDQTGTFLGMRAAVRPMIEAGGGSIVNISSTSGFWGLPEITAYTAAKWAVRGMTKAAAVELGQFNIRVNSLHPGAVDTAMSRGNEDWAAHSPGGFTYVPLGRIGQPEEIASLAAFLLSDESSFCTGSEFVADGGALAGPVRRS
ncbi:glucose 1-dehydrogenase [Amycolatopsis acididurans]|uniref:glucose 1-dehydrogenase n=1 Tax=Amycolatopsis acididurans TaxID=2724524 RepID=UPI0028A87EA1|nr:glucose 1-dehydrogenase [Amycolatopsis acididurans]